MTAAIDARQRQTADNLIRKYGAPAVLRRDNGGDRSCWACITQYSAYEKMGKMINQIDRKALVSAIGLTIDPDSEQDKLITFDPTSGAENEALRIIAPIGKLEQGQTVVYWELQVRR